jgi:hypothetical protein
MINNYASVELDIMRKYLRITIGLILIICYYFSHAQIVLDESDLPMIDDVQVTTIVDSAMADTLSPGVSGPGVNWNFSWLQFCCIDISNTRWVNPQYTDSASFFPEADIAQKTHCYFYHDWETHVITEICDNRDYYIKDTAGLKYYGSDYPYSHKINNYRIVFPLLSYGQTKTNNCRIVIQQSPDSVLVTNISDTIIVDGWGTLITPLGTYNTIRIFTKETVWDSLYVSGIGELVEYMPDNYYYKWYTKELGFPVLQISKGILETSPYYQIARVAKYKWIDVSVPEVLQNNFNASVFPNPITNESALTFDLAESSVLHITLSDMMGRTLTSFVKNFDPGIHELFLYDLFDTELAKGIYSLTFSIDGMPATFKLVKE